jgi:hemoglobin
MEINPEKTPYVMLGGQDGVDALAKAFYDRMERDDDVTQVRSLHAEDLTEAREKFRKFLTGWLGGPQLYMEAFGHPRLRMRHAPFSIGDDQVTEWLTCMGRAMDDCTIEGPIRSFLDERFIHVANFLRNT